MINFSSVSSAISTVGRTVSNFIANGVDTISELYSGGTGAYCVGPGCGEGLINATSAMRQMGGNPDDLSLPHQVAGIDCVYRNEYIP